MFNKLENYNGAFVIAEVGQNHQGDLDLALKYIEVFGSMGADAIKFQTRNNKILFSEDAYNANYDSENSFASTYGEHREKLELKPEWLPILKKKCKECNVKFISTPFDESSLNLLVEVGVDALKIASFDIGNVPFIKKISKVGCPVIMSIGGASEDRIEISVQAVLESNANLALLHCVSEYPCEYEKLGLSNITELTKKYPNCTIGLSDHFSGILSGPIGYMLGAKVFEKHVTLNRAWKGTDHSFALEPEGFRKFVRDIKSVRKMLPQKAKNEIGKEPVFKKLGKSVIANRDLKIGELLTEEVLSGKIFKVQFHPVRDVSDLLNKRILKDIASGQPITKKDVE